METKTKTKSANSPLTDDNPSHAASPATKRKTPEPTDTTEAPGTPSSIHQRADSATISGVIASLSPMQNRHFVGELVDENNSIRIVGFHDRVRRNLQQMSTSNTPVTLTKCAIDTNKYTDTLQVIVKGNSSVTVVF